MRFLRLVIGIAIIVQAVVAKDIMLGIAGIFFTSLPVFNIGCCAGGNCYVPAKKEISKNESADYLKKTEKVEDDLFIDDTDDWSTVPAFLRRNKK
mgnify:CR=1 FL=1